MTTDNRSSAGPRAPLPQPQLPEVAAQGGINLDDVTGGGTILLQAGPYDKFLAGDRLDVFWGAGEALAGSAVVREASNYYAFVDLSAALIAAAGSGTHPFFYRFTSNLGGPPIDSPHPRPTVRVKLEPPGNPDTGPDPVNPNLAAPAVVPLAIDSEAAKDGAVVTIQPWANMDAGDELTLLWGGESLIVTGPPVGQPVVIPVSEATILAAKDNPALPVRYRIRDAVGNGSKLSPSAFVNVLATVTFYEKPKVIGAPGDVLDLTALGAADVGVQVDTEQEDVAVGDTVLLTWAGTAADGTALPEEHLSREVTNDSYLDFAVPNAAAAPLAQGTALLYYAINGRPSAVRHLAVTGEVQTLAAPLVQEARDGALDPADVAGAVHVQVDPYAGMSMGDRVTYVWKGFRNGESASFLTDFHDVTEGDVTPVKKPLVFAVPKAEAEALEGGTLEIYYKVDLYGQGEQPPSPTLTLEVGEGAGLLPAPTVDHVVDGVLDPADAPLGTKVRLTVMRDLLGVSARGLLAYDTVRVFWNGDGGSNSYSDAIRFTPGREAVFTIDAKYITGNEGFTVSVHYELEGAGETPKPSKVLPVRVGAALELAAPTLKEAPGNVLDPLEALAALTLVVPTPLGPADLLSVVWVGGDGGRYATDPAPVSETGQSVALPLTLVAYSLGKTAKISYAVTRGGNPPVISPEQAVAVQAIPQASLPVPYILQAEDEGQGDTLSLGDLVENGAYARVALWPHVAAGQRLWLRLSGKNEGGADVSLVIWSGKTVENADIQRGYVAYAVAYDALKNLAEGSALRMYFAVNFSKINDEANAAAFPERAYTVIVLAPPTLKEAAGNVLDPLAALAALTLVVPTALEPADLLSAVWVAADGARYATEPKPVSEVGQALALPVSLVAYSLGKTVQISYAVTRGDYPPVASPARAIPVQAIPQASLPKPYILQAEDGGQGTVFNLASVQDEGAELRVPLWPHIAVDQNVWLRLMGTNADGTPFLLTLWAGADVYPSEIDRGYLRKYVHRNELNKLGHDTTLTTHFAVSFNRVNDEATAVIFPGREYLIKTFTSLEVPVITHAYDDQGVAQGNRNNGDDIV